MNKRGKGPCLLSRYCRVAGELAYNVRNSLRHPHITNCINVSIAANSNMFRLQEVAILPSVWYGLVSRWTECMRGKRPR